MEALAPPLLLISLGLAVLVVVAIFRRTSTKHYSSPLLTQQTTVVVSDPAIVRLMLIDHADAFSNRPMAHFPDDFTGTHSINTVPYGPMWRALRGNLTAGILHPTRLGLLAPLQRDAIEALVIDLTTKFPAGDDEVVVVRESLHAAVFGLTVRMCFGDRVSDQAVVRAMEHEVRQFVFTFVEDSAVLARSRLPWLLHRRRWLRYTGTFGRVSRLVLPLISTRRRANNAGGGAAGIRCYVDSLLDLWVPVNDDETTGSKKRPLMDKEMVRLVFEFLGANTESIVSCVEWTLAHLITNPEFQKKLHREIAGEQEIGKGGVVVSEERLRGMPYLRAAILESLRLHAPVPLIMRDVSGADAAVFGTPLTPTADGMPPVRLIVKVRDIGTSRKVWTDPDEFRPERFLAGGEAEGVGPVPGPKQIRMAPFGAGRRYCPGVGISIVHVASFLAALVREFEWRLPANGGHNIDMRELRAFFMVMKTPLRARITPRALTI